ncbi:hypothetical protein BRC82_03050 [Halobacteriales archaeon QS_1_67_19]|nr:MAG: hypothetical protein BRC82_03050 [Halobacteriales archaeon QS_1_67_19]
MTGGARVAVALAVVLVVAGATPATGDRAGAAGEQPTIESTVSSHPEPTSLQSSPDGESTATENNVSLETIEFEPTYDPHAVLDRVERLRGLDALNGITIHEYDEKPSREFDIRDAFAGIRPVGARALQLYSNASAERTQPLGYTVEREGAVHVYLMNASDLEQYGVSQELVLAHEFVHAIQFQQELLSPSRDGLRSEFPRWTTDTMLVATAVIEGDAMWVTEQYVERYGEGNYSVEAYNRSLNRSAWPHSLGGLPYYYGYQFYERAGSAPVARSDAIRQPPNATAELLDPDAPIERRPAPEPAPTEFFGTSELSRYHTDTVGELVVRHVFRLNGLSFDRAAAAADGWVNDRMYYYAAGNGSNPVIHWTTAWENDSEAAAFADAWRAMVAANDGRSVGNGVIRVPASDEAPGGYYVLERDGATVRITVTAQEERAMRLAAA